MAKRIGIFGGTFDPPHFGHLIIAREALKQTKLDKIFFIPAFKSALKPHSPYASDKHRLRMLKLATEGEEKYEVLDIELKRGGISYTIDTLRELKKMNPDDVLYLIIGGDQLTDFKKWKNANEIADLITLIVYERDGHHFSFAITTPNANIVRLKAPRIDVSSTDIRKRIGKGQSIADYVPLKVEKYIKKEQLYRK